MATFNLNSRIKIVNPNSNVDSDYGTYASIAAAELAVPIVVREKGKTVGIINEAGDVVEYWWVNSIADGALVPKLEGSAGTSGTDGTSGTNGQPGVGINFMGEVATQSLLPLDATQGDAYIVQDYPDALFIWNGSAWVDGGSIQGPQGNAGTNGTSGTNGSDGTSGTNGTSGSNGTNGSNGTSGTNGTSGSSGVNGLQGEAGYSTGQIYE